VPVFTKKTTAEWKLLLEDRFGLGALSQRDIDIAIEVERMTHFTLSAAQPAPAQDLTDEEKSDLWAWLDDTTPLAQPAPVPLTPWTEAQHERAYRNSRELHKDVKSLAAFKRVAKEVAAMYGITKGQP
jgi:hypothetical protein